MSATLELAKMLISQASVTPNDGNCQTIISSRLGAAGFYTEMMPFGEVSNTWIRHGEQSPALVFAGHTDVVPPGPEEQWTSLPFQPTIRNNRLYGRGAADMKTSVAAMTIACENFVRSHPDHKGSVALLLTSDEEGDAVDGTAKVIDQLLIRNEKIDWCVIGEPTSCNTLGDTLKVGRRGSLSATLQINGLQGHVAYPQLAKNPIHEFAPALHELAQLNWDCGNQYFPATTFQISNINAGTGAANVIPGVCVVEFNLRFSPEVTEQEITNKIEQLLNSYELDYAIKWHLSGNPFYCEPAQLARACEQAIQETLDITPELSTSGGTSDGRFIAPTGAQVVELGPVNESIHKVDEYIELDAIEKLTEIYTGILQKLLL